MRLREFDTVSETMFSEEDIKTIYEIDQQGFWTVLNYEDKSDLVFRKSPIFDETLIKFPNLQRKFEDFLKLKKDNFAAPFGSSDKNFTKKGFYDRFIPGLKHAHLNRDVSIVYKIHGSTPRYCDLYGLFTHADLGTGDPPNIRRQENKATSFSNLTFR